MTLLEMQWNTFIVDFTSVSVLLIHRETVPYSAVMLPNAPTYDKILDCSSQPSSEYIAHGQTWIPSIH